MSNANVPVHKTQNERYHYMTSGALGGVAGTIVGHPLDTVKTQLQIAGTFSHPRQAITYIYQNAGIRGFFKGIGPPITTNAFSNVLTFGVYGAVKGVLPNNQPEWLKGATGGAIAGLSSSWLVTPRDLIKCRVQASCCAAMSNPKQLRYSSIDCMSAIMKTKGYRGLFQGNLSTILRDVPGNTVYFAVYEGMKKLLSANQSEPSGAAIMASGAMAGASYWTFIYPIDTIRTRVQIQDTKGFIQCAKEIWGRQKFQGFYRGFNLAIGRTLAISAISFYVYEWTLKLQLGKY